MVVLSVFWAIFPHFVRHLAPLNSSQNKKICLKKTSQNNKESKLSVINDYET